MNLTNRARLLNRRTHQKMGGKRLPFLLFMTDEKRMADPLEAVKKLPRGAGVIFRHYGSANRRAMAKKLRRLCRLRRLVLLIAGDLNLARQLGCGAHLPEGLAAKMPAEPRAFKKGGILTVASHGPRAIARAKYLGADGVILSPVFETRSHPQALPLGPLRFHLWIRRGTIPAYPLGGINQASCRRLGSLGISGYAGISGLY